MKKTFFYWSPFLTHVGTVKSTINSAIALKKDILIMNPLL